MITSATASRTVQKKIHISKIITLSEPYTNGDDISHASCTKENTNLTPLRHQQCGESSGYINIGIGRTLQKSHNMQTGSHLTLSGLELGNQTWGWGW